MNLQVALLFRFKIVGDTEAMQRLDTAAFKFENRLLDTITYKDFDF